jgi:hypothetical protein
MPPLLPPLPPPFSPAVRPLQVAVGLLFGWVLFGRRKPDRGAVTTPDS